MTRVKQCGINTDKTMTEYEFMVFAAIILVEYDSSAVNRNLANGVFPCVIWC